MNKQQLTKTFSFSKWLLFFFFAVGITMSSCGEDYDGDIDNLQKQINELGSYKELTGRIGTLEADLAATKVIANDALAKAEKALGEGGNDPALAAEVAALQTKVANIEKAQADLAAVSKSLDDRIAALEANGVPDAVIEEIIAKVKVELGAIEPGILNLIGHRVTSLVRIPTQTLNDEPAIIFTNLSYIPQVFNPHVGAESVYGFSGTQTAYTQNVNGVLTDHQGNGEVTVNKPSAKRLFIDNKSTLVQYQVSPASSINASNIEAPYFMGSIQNNINLRALNPEFAGRDLPIKVASWSLDEATGILSVNVTKSVPADVNINFETVAGLSNGVQTFTNENYYITSLRTIIPEADRTEEEKTNGIVPVVASEFSRLAEITVVPMIKQKYRVNKNEYVNAEAQHAHTINPEDRQELLNGKNVQGRYVHYHDSISLYNALEGQLIDHSVNWDEDVDLTKYVTVCEFENIYVRPDGTDIITVGSHDDIANYKDYGLEFRFAVATAPSFAGGSHETNQQAFAEINGNIMTSRVYDIPGKTRTAVGREPIIRIQLVDTRNNDNLVAQRYMKFVWTDVVDVKDIDVNFPQDTVTCKRMQSTLYTKEMNEDFYRKLEAAYGYSKETFHKMYKNAEIVSLTKDGQEILFNPPLTWTALDDSSFGGTGTTTAKANDYAKIVNPINKSDLDKSQREDVIFAMANDDQAGVASRTYNLIWYMSPKAVGTIKDFQKSDYVLTVKFKGAGAGSGYSDLHVRFHQSIIVPPQKFDYQGTYWANQKGIVDGKGTYNINPLTYNANRDYVHLGIPNFVTPQDWTGWNTGKDFYNHIGADLAKGWVNPVTKSIPSHLGEYIAYIRSCANVAFEFNDKLFGQGEYAYLANYHVTNNRQALWIADELPLNADQLETYQHPTTPLTYWPGVASHPRYDNLAATIDNKFGSTDLSNYDKTNKSNLPWFFDEPLGSKVNQVYSQLNLSEVDESNGSTAAKSLIGKKVPMQLMVAYNEYNNVPVQDFDVFFFTPLIVSEVKPGYFVDGIPNGSYVDVKDEVKYTDVKGFYVSRSVLTPPANATAAESRLYDFSQILWDYYQVRDIVFNTQTATTNLDLVGNSIVPVPNYKGGKLPAGVQIDQVANYNQVTGEFTSVLKDPFAIRYYNSYGTPVNHEYEIYMDVVAKYKWEDVVTRVTIPVKPYDPQDPTIVTRKK